MIASIVLRPSEKIFRSYEWGIIVVEGLQHLDLTLVRTVFKQGGLIIVPLLLRSRMNLGLSRDENVK